MLKMSGLRRFHPGKRTAVVLECLSIPVGCAPHTRDVPGGENKRVKVPSKGEESENLTKVRLLHTTFTQRYVASRRSPDHQSGPKFICD